MSNISVQTKFVMGLIFVTSWRPDQPKSKSQFSGDFLKIMPKVKK